MLLWSLGPMPVARNTKMNKVDTYSLGICMLDEKMESQFNTDSIEREDLET